MKKIFNKKGTSLIEVIISFTIISIVFVTVMSGLNIFSGIIFNSKEKKTKLNDLISAVNDFNFNNDNITIDEKLESISFILNDEETTLPIRIKTYSIKSQPEKKLVTFSKY